MCVCASKIKWKLYDHFNGVLVCMAAHTPIPPWPDLSSLPLDGLPLCHPGHKKTILSCSKLLSTSLISPCLQGPSQGRDFQILSVDGRRERGGGRRRESREENREESRGEVRERGLRERGVERESRGDERGKERGVERERERAEETREGRREELRERELRR